MIVMLETLGPGRRRVTAAAWSDQVGLALFLRGEAGLAAFTDSPILASVAARALLSGIGLVAIGAGVAGVPAIASSLLWAQPWPVIVLALLVGWEFAGVGLFAWWRRPENRVGQLMTIVGFAWFANGAWVSSNALLHTIGLDLDGLYLAALAHMLLAFPSGRLADRSDRTLVIAAYLVVVLGALPALLFLDTSGGTGGIANLLLVRSEPGLARLLLLLRQLVGVIVVVAVAVRLVRRWRRASPGRQRALTPVLGTGAMVTALTAVDLAVDASYRAPAVAVTGIHLLALLALLVVPRAYLVGLLRARFLQAGAVEGLVARLAEGRGIGRLRTALVRALGDDSIEVAYWFTERGCYGDEQGRPVRLPEPGAGRAVARIERDGRRVGAILYAAPEPDQADLVESIAGVAALAMENEQLEAALRARVTELERSRPRSWRRPSPSAGAWNATCTTGYSSGW